MVNPWAIQRFPPPREPRRRAITLRAGTSSARANHKYPSEGSGYVEDFEPIIREGGCVFCIEHLLSGCGVNESSELIEDEQTVARCGADQELFRLTVSAAGTATHGIRECWRRGRTGP